jgi:hypothetical protein
MPRSGGTAAKFGDRYEGQWTVFCLTDVLLGEAVSIRPEAPGEDGFEFWLQRPSGHREFHQTKRQLSGAGHWTLAELQAAGVLNSIKSKLSEDTEASCHFASVVTANELRELSERADGAVSFTEFQSEFLATSSDVQRRFDLLCGYWETPTQTAFTWLKRVQVRTVDEVTLRSFIRGRLASVVAGAEPGTITDVLAQYVLANLEQELTEHHIWTHLRSRGLRPREWSRDISVVQSVAGVTERFLGQLRREVIPSRNGPIIVPRDETKTAVEHIVGPGAKSGVLLSGTAGVGKSGVLLQVTDAVASLGWPILAFRADRFDDPYLTADQLGIKLGLPGSPAAVLAAIAHGDDCLLVIDQLDAVSLASGRAAQLFDCIEEMLQQVRGFPKMRVLLACRAFDLENDHRLHQLTDRDGIAQGVPVQGLPETSVREIVGQLGFDPAALTVGQLDLFSAPLHLRLLSESGTARRDLSAISTVQDLYRHYWSRKQQQVRQRLGREPRWTDVVDALVDYISDRQSGLAAPKEVVDSWPTDASAMASEHVLVEDGGRYALFHETLFDFAFALRFIARGKSLIDLLLGDEQHLFRRAQLRQLLAYQRSVDFDEYLANLSAVLVRPDIRFHLKDVAFAWLSGIADPRPEEWAVIEPLIFDVTYPFNRHAWLMLQRSPAWMSFLDRQRALVRWLTSADETVVNATVSLLANMQQH